MMGHIRRVSSCGPTSEHPKEEHFQSGFDDVSKQHLEANRLQASLYSRMLRMYSVMPVVTHRRPTHTLRTRRGAIMCTLSLACRLTVQGELRCPVKPE